MARRGSVLATVLALTWLNPHVYLDTVLLVGSLANQHGADGRWWFTAGAAARERRVVHRRSATARGCSRPLFARPATWRVLDVVIGLVMFAIAAALLARLRCLSRPPQAPTVA